MPGSVLVILLIINGLIITLQHPFCCSYFPFKFLALAQDDKVEREPRQVIEVPQIKDPNIQAELVADGLDQPTSMVFAGPDDILVLEKSKGTVQRIVNGNVLPEPLLDVNVNSRGERGMLGIVIAREQRAEGQTFSAAAA